MLATAQRVLRQLRHDPRTVALLLVAVAVACGGDASGGAYGESDAVTVEGSEVTVSMEGLQFHPQGIRVRPGRSWSG